MSKDIHSEKEKPTKDWEQIKADYEEQEEGGDEGSSASTALEHPNYAALEEQLTLAEQKAHENWEKSVRAVAELDNVRRRLEREVINAHKYGVEKLINALLPVADSLEQAMQLADKSEDKSMHEGLELTMKLFHGALEKFEVEQLDPVGAVFDPQMHEAMAVIDAPDAQPNSVVTVFQKGYKLSERVIRPARVVVSKK